MQRSLGTVLLVLGLLFLSVAAASAHFGMIIPSDEMIMKGDSANISLQLMF